ncbi:1679_t:CDS:1, partial [Funneliformis geosporum]
ASRQATLKKTEEYSDFKSSVMTSPLASTKLISFSNSSFLSFNGAKHFFSEFRLITE